MGFIISGSQYVLISFLSCLMAFFQLNCFLVLVCVCCLISAVSLVLFRVSDWWPLPKVQISFLFERLSSKLYYALDVVAELLLISLYGIDSLLSHQSYLTDCKLLLYTYISKIRCESEWFIHVIKRSNKKVTFTRTTFLGLRMCWIKNTSSLYSFIHILSILNNKNR